MRRKYLGCHPGRSASSPGPRHSAARGQACPRAREARPEGGALQTQDPSTPASEKKHGRGTWIPALATLGRMTTEETAPYAIALPQAGRRGEQAAGLLASNRAGEAVERFRVL